MNAHPWPLADYLAGELGPEQHAAVDAHLVECDQCWREVQLARLGQLAAQRSAQSTPEDVRERIIDAIRAVRVDGATPGPDATVPQTAEGTASPRRARRYLVLAVAASVIGAIVVFGAGLAAGRHTARQHAVGPATTSTTTAGAPMGTVAAALSYFQQAMLPGTGIATAPAPDLRALGLRVTGASNGTLASQPVTAYVYCDRHGTRQVYVFLSATTFRAVAPPGGAPTETRTVGDYTLFSAVRHPMLIVGRDRALVTAVGTRLT